MPDSGGHIIVKFTVAAAVIQAECHESALDSFPGYAQTDSTGMIVHGIGYTFRGVGVPFQAPPASRDMWDD
jgi:hypothetical protein